MKRLVGVLVVALLGAAATAVYAISPFKTAFKKKYIDTHKDKDFQSAAKKAGCNVCHVKGATSKKVQNDYGKLLNKLIEGDANKRIKDAKKKSSSEGAAETKKVLAELEKAFEAVAKTKSESGKGPTYGELIKSGKLPVDLKKATAKYKEEKAKADKEKAEVKDAG